MTEVVNDPGPLTNRQRTMFVQLGFADSGFALVSVTEKSTGKQRAIVARVNEVNDEEYFFEPVALLLDVDNDIDLFVAPMEEATI